VGATMLQMTVFVMEVQAGQWGNGSAIKVQTVVHSVISQAAWT